MLRRLIALSLLAALAAMLCRSDVSAQDKMAPVKDSDALAPGEYFGTMLVTPGSDRSFTLRLEQKNLVPTGTTRRPAAIPAVLPRWTPALNALLAKVLADQRNYQNHLTSVARARTPAAKQSANRSLASSAATLRNSVIAFNRLALATGIANAQLMTVASSGAPQFTVRTYTQDVEFQATESVKVRTLVLPEQFDEKGNVKKYTRAELAELKGKDKNLPGFESALEKLEVGQKVRVLLVQTAKAPAPAPKDKDKDKDKDKKAKDDDEKKKQVKMITIVETEGDAAAGPAPKKKKN
jgi:hypothetical protein